MRVVFAGTPGFAAEHLRFLLDHIENEVVGVYTQPDRPAGRGKKITASPVKQLAEARGLLVHQPSTLRDASAQQTLAHLNPDLMIVVAYGLILPKNILAIPRHGCIMSMLHCYRVGVVRRRYSVPLKQVMLKRGSPSCKWMKVWIPVIVY